MISISGGDSYPPYIFDETDPIRLTEVVAGANGLALSSRSVDEIMMDYDIERRAINSQEASMSRRKPKRYESQLVVDFLDDIDSSIMAIGAMVAKHARVITVRNHL